MDNYFLRIGTPPFCYGKVREWIGTELQPTLKLRTSPDVVGFVRRSRLTKQGSEHREKLPALLFQISYIVHYKFRQSHWHSSKKKSEKFGQNLPESDKIGHAVRFW